MIESLRTAAAVEMCQPTLPFDQASWDRWTARGRADDLAQREKIRTVAVIIAAFAAGLTFWFL